MADKKKKKGKVSVRLLVRIGTLLVLLGSMVALVVTGLYVRDIIAVLSGEMISINGEEEDLIEKVDTDALTDLLKRIEEKNDKETKAPDDRRNPFAKVKEPEPEPEPEPETTPEPEPEVEVIPANNGTAGQPAEEPVVVRPVVDEDPAQPGSEE